MGDGDLEAEPGAMTRAGAAASTDPALRAFAATLDDRFLVVDLRRAELGAGFAWGRFGPDTTIRRAGLQRIFACAPPAPGRWNPLRHRG